MTASRAKVLLADDHGLLRDMLVRRLNEEPDLVVVAAVGDAATAVPAAIETGPDLLVLDIDMPGVSVFEAVRQVRAQLAQVRVIFLSAYVQDGFITQALEVHASGYLTKGHKPEHLIGCIRRVLGGGTCFSPEVEHRLELSAGAVLLSDRPRTRLELLTAREKQVLGYLARGLSKKEIARLSGTSVKTVDHHCQHVMEKLDLHDRVDLTRYAIREGLVSA